MRRLFALPWPYVLALVVGVALVYAQTARFSLLACDDPSYTTLCPFVKDGLTWANINSAFFKEFCWSGIYMPLVSLTYMVDFSLFGGSAVAFHLVSVVFHALNAVLFFVLLLRLCRYAASDSFAVPRPSSFIICFLAAALWALHPLRVESVAWVASRKDVMFTFFTLIGLLLWLRLVGGVGLSRFSQLALGGLAFLSMLCACLCKPTAMCFPFLAVCIEGLFVSWRDWSVSFVVRKMPKYIPFVLLAAATGLLAAYSQTHYDGTEALKLYVGTFSWRMQNALVSLGLQLKHALWPLDLTYYYRPNHDGAPFDAMAGYLSLVTAAGLFWWAFKVFPALRRALICCGLFFVFSIGPTLGVAASFGRQAYADRFTYVPMMAFSILLVLAYVRLSSGNLMRRGSFLAMIGGLTALVAAYAVEAGLYTRTFRDELTVSNRVLEIDELNADALRVVGGAHLIQDADPSEAISYFRNAIAIDPQHQAVLDLAFALRKRGRPEDLAEFTAMTEQFRADPTIDELGLVVDMLASDAEKSGNLSEARRFYQAMTRVHNPVFAAKAREWLKKHP